MTAYIQQERFLKSVTCTYNRNTLLCKMLRRSLKGKCHDFQAGFKTKSSGGKPPDDFEVVQRSVMTLEGHTASMDFIQITWLRQERLEP